MNNDEKQILTNEEIVKEMYGDMGTGKGKKNVFWALDQARSAERSKTTKEIFAEVDSIILDDRKSLTPIVYGAYQATKKKFGCE